MTSKETGRLLGIRAWIPEITLVVGTTAAGVWAQGRWLNPTSDPGLWWTLIERVGNGERCYQDIWMQYGPLAPYLLGALARPFAYSAAALLLINWILAITVGVLLLRVSGVFLSTFERLAVAGLVVSIGIFAPGRARLVLSYSPAAVLAMCLSLAAVLLVRREARSRVVPFAAGSLAGLAFCSKQEIGVAAILALGLPVVMRTRSLRGWGLPCLTGFALIAGAGASFVLSEASFDSLRHDSHLWPIGTVPESWRFLFRLSAGLSFDWHRRVLWAAAGLASLLLLVVLASLLLTRDRRIRRSVLMIAAAALLVGVGSDFQRIVDGWDPLCLSMLVAFALVLFALLDRRRPGRDLLAVFAVFAALVATRAAFSGSLLWSPYSGMGNIATAVTWGLFLFLLPEVFPGGQAGRLARQIIAVLVFLIALPGVWSGARALARPSSLPFDTAKGRVWLDPPLAPFFSILSCQLRPGENVLCVPESNAVEPLLGVRSASPYTDLVPGWLDSRAEENLINRFERQPPDAVVIFRRPTQEFGIRPFGEGYGTRLAGWILAHYRPVARSSSGVLLRR